MPAASARALRERVCAGHLGHKVNTCPSRAGALESEAQLGVGSMPLKRLVM